MHDVYTRSRPMKDQYSLPQHIEFNGKTIECKKALDVKDKQHMNNGGHNQNPSVYGGPPAAAGYPPPGYPAPPMPGYGAYPPYAGYGGESFFFLVFNGGESYFF